MTESSAVQSKRPAFVTLIAVYHFLVAGSLLLGAAILALIMVVVLFEETGQEAIPPIAVLALIELLLSLLLGANIAAGWGVLALKNWARWLAIILAVFSLPNIPEGTGVGIFKLWYLFTPEAKVVFGVES